MQCAKEVECKNPSACRHKCHNHKTECLNPEQAGWAAITVIIVIVVNDSAAAAAAPPPPPPLRCHKLTAHFKCFDDRFITSF